MKEDDRWW